MQDDKHTTQTNVVEKGAFALLFKRLAVYRWQIILLCFFASFSVCLSFSPHLLVWWLAENILVSERIPESTNLLIACALAFCGLVGRYGFAAITSIGSHFIAFNVQKDLRVELAQKLASAPMGYLENQRRGDLIKLAVDDVESLEDGIAHLIPELTASLVAPLLLLSAMLIFDWRMALVAMLPAVLSFLILRLLMHKGRNATQTYQSGLSEISAVSQETISAFPLVKTHGANMIVLERAKSAFRDFQHNTTVWIREALVPSSWFQILTTSAPVFVLPAGIVLYMNQMLTLGELVFFIIIATNLGNMFTILGSLSHRLENQKDSLHRIFSVLATPSMPVKKSSVSPDSYGIEFKNVTFAYDNEPVLKNIDLTISEGESVALVGPSGSGKSTLLRLIYRFWDVSDGQIAIGGKDIRELTPETLNNSLSCVFQDVFLFSQSVRDNIRLGAPNASDEDIVAAAKAAMAHDFICALPSGYDTLLLEGGGNLSGGQRQRLSIARAILRNKPILLLDEATAFADPQNESRVQQAISALAEDKTIIAIAHRLNTVVNMDRIVVLDDGCIIDQGTHDDLLTRCELYRQLWLDYQSSESFQLSKSASVDTAGSTVFKDKPGDKVKSDKGTTSS